jgi:hypothetical protein
MSDLWPKDITKITVKAPLAILQEQATNIGKITNHLVEGEVEVIERSMHLKKDTFGFSFNIVGPVLGGYTYKLFSVYYQLSMYPIRIDLEDDIKKDLKAKLTDYKEVDKPWNLVLAESEEEFLKVLTAIFASKKTRQVIQAILSQSGAKVE